MEHYGDDIDGNRGIMMTSFELDSDDIPEIESQILEYIQSTGELPDSNFTVYLIDPISEDTIEFDINPFNYICKSVALEYLANQLED
jgi:hypothetical protein